MHLNFLRFHLKTEGEINDSGNVSKPNLYSEEIKGNQETQHIRHMTYFGWLIERIE